MAYLCGCSFCGLDGDEVGDAAARLGLGLTWRHRVLIWLAMYAPLRPCQQNYWLLSLTLNLTSINQWKQVQLKWLNGDQNEKWVLMMLMMTAPICEAYSSYWSAGLSRQVLHSQRPDFLWKRRYNFALSYQSQLHFQLSETDLLFPDNFHAFQIDHHWLMELGNKQVVHHLTLFLADGCRVHDKQLRPRVISTADSSSSSCP